MSCMTDADGYSIALVPTSSEGKAKKANTASLLSLLYKT
jgi:hypothetical protein